MDEKDISLAARKMIELYGDDAELIAADRAEIHAASEEIEDSLAWERIATVICELRHPRRSVG